MKLYQQGDEKAFNMLYQRHSSKLYGYLRLKLSRQPDLCDDILQASFMKLHRSKGRYDSQYPFLPWLFTICRSELLDTLKKKKIETLPLLEDVEDQSLMPSSERQDAIAVEVSALSKSQKEAIEMRYLKEMSFDDIAVRMQSTPENIRQLVSRGLRELRSKLGTRSKT